MTIYIIKEIDKDFKGGLVELDDDEQLTKYLHAKIPLIYNTFNTNLVFGFYGDRYQAIEPAVTINHYDFYQEQSEIYKTNQLMGIL